MYVILIINQVFSQEAQNNQAIFCLFILILVNL